jgi:MFS family permease
MSAETTLANRPRTARNTAWPYVLVTVGLFMLLFGANLPAPLYGVYRERFGFSLTVLTLIFATYAVVLIPSLVLFGQLSDRYGRRGVIAVGLGASAVALTIFAVAQSRTVGGVGWLVVARAVQGLAVGATTGTATAALVELQRQHDPQHAATAATIAQAGGSAIGPLVAGLFAQYLPWPFVLCFAIGAILSGLVGLAVLRVPQPRAAGARWRPQLPSLPAGSRDRFARAGLTAACVWGVGALFISVVPTYASTILHTRNLAVLGATSAIMLGTAGITQFWLARHPQGPARGQLVGLAFLATGLLALVLAFPMRSGLLLAVAGVLAGGGLGIGFASAQTDINHLAPPDRRGEVTAAFIVCVYSGVTVTAITVGLLADSLSLFAGVAVVATMIAAVAVANVIWLRRSL